MRKTVKILLSSFLGIVFLFALSEMYLRAIYHKFDFEIGWKFSQHSMQPKPYVMYGPSPGEYRGNPAIFPKPKNEFRVFILGGSTVHFGSPPLPELLETRLKTLNRNLRVYNYGVVSQNSRQALIRLILEISTVSPDLILFYDGANDIMDPYFWDPRPGYPYNFLAYENNPLINRDFNAYPFWSLVGLGSRLIRRLFFDYYRKTFFNQEKLRAEANYLSVDWRKKIAKIYCENHFKANLISSAIGAKYVGYFQPLLYFKKNLSAAESQLPSYNKDITDFALSTRELVLQECKKPMYRKRDFILRDLSAAFDKNNDTVFIDYVHTTQAGIEAIADVIFDDLKLITPND